MDLQVLLAIIGTLSGIFLGWSARTKTIRSEVKTDTKIETTLQSDMSYLKRGVDDIKFEQRGQRQQIEGINARLIKIEVSYDALSKCVNDHIAAERN